MTESARDHTTGVGEERRADDEARERLDTDPAEQPNAPNREHHQEFVRNDLSERSGIDPASDDDELDRPDNSGA
jgi:hypothetical protein